MEKLLSELRETAKYQEYQELFEWIYHQLEANWLGADEYATHYQWFWRFFMENYYQGKMDIMIVYRDQKIVQMAFIDKALQTRQIFYTKSSTTYAKP